MRGLLFAAVVLLGCQRPDGAAPPEAKVQEAAPVQAPAEAKAPEAKAPEEAKTAEAKAPAEAKAAEAEEPAAAPEPEEGPALAVAAADRGCTKDDECTVILTQCSMCEGACTGVRSDRAAGYADRLDCSKYRGMVCNYDCRPRFKIEAPRCVGGRCESVRIKPP